MFLILLTNRQQIDKPKQKPSDEAYGSNGSIQTWYLACHHRNLERNLPWRRHVGGISPNLCCPARSDTRAVPWTTFQPKASKSVRLDLVANSTRTHDCPLCATLALVDLRCLARCDHHRFECQINLRTP